MTWATGVRPNSPPQTTSVSSSSPRCLRSVMSAAIGRSIRISGDVKGDEDLIILGEVSGTKDMRIGVENFLKNGPRAKAEFVHE